MAKNAPQNSKSFKIFTNSCIQSFVLLEICEEEVNSCIANIKSGSAQGSDEIPPKFVKLSKCIISPLLTKLFNKSIKQGTFPNSFKIAHVIPIPKVSSRKSFDDLRPFSLLPAFAKIFEKILETKMTRFLDKNKIITPSQFGFRTNSSTELAITTLYVKLLTNLNKNKVIFSLSLDLKKAFDSVNHPILLKKLYHYGFRGPIFNLLQSYLSNRRICAMIERKTSKLCSVNYGIPQGSVLVPLLFLLYVNDLPYVSKFEVTLFADDTNLHLSHNNIKSLQIQTTNELDKINNWINANKLTINYKKRCFMLVGNKQAAGSDFNLCINDIKIAQSDHVKYLGVHLDSKLSWKIHIEKLTCKLSKVCGMIYKLRLYVPFSTLKLFYYAMFHSLLQYSLLNWGRACKSHYHRLVILQNNILRACLFRPLHHPTNSVLNVLKIS